MLNGLKKKRIEQGYTVEAVSNRLAIPVRNLIAIEEGNFNALPPLIYVNGFIKSYCQLLGLNPEPFIAEFSDLYSDSVRQSESPNKIVFPNFFKVLLIPFAFQTEWVAWAVIIFMLLGSWMGYTHLTDNNVDQQNVIEASIMDENSDGPAAAPSENQSYRNHDPSAFVSR
jgi:cytoskeletal protein RodZ